jgi:hypothetical protein
MSQGTVAAPALLLEILLSRLAELCIPRTLCQILRKDAIFQEIEFQSQQIACARDIAEGERDIPILINALARAFEYPRSRVQSALVHGLESPGQRGKNMAVDQDRAQQLLD